jgi:tetratricopeptide (TPR) repeat protein
VTLAFLLGRRVVRPGVGLVIAVVALAVVALTYGSMTYARNRDFWSEETIWRDTVLKRPDNSRARMNYGVTLVAARRIHDAEGQLREAVRLNDTNVAAHLNLGSLLASTGRPDEGVRHLERVLALDPNHSAVFRNLGEAHGALGNRLLATKYFSLAVEKHPDDVFLLNRLGWLLATSPEDSVRDGPRAVTVAERAVRLTSRTDATSLDTLAAAYAEAGSFDEAVAVAREAVSVARRQGPQELLPELEARLRLYESRTRYRER